MGNSASEELIATKPNTGLRVVRLQSNNVLRLVAVDITPEGNLVLIGGKNGAGKSSVLNSMAMAIGGAAFVPTEPIHTGETDGSVTLDLGDLIVTRKFTRDRIHANECVSGLAVGTIDAPDKKLPCNCTPTYSETRSTLVVTNKEGARYPSPQAMLDKLLGKLTFDPLAFARLSETSEGRKQQQEILRRVVNLDTSDIDNQRKTAYTERTMQKKTLDIKQAQMLALPKFDGVPAEELSIDAITQEMEEAERLQKLADTTQQIYEKIKRNIEAHTIQVHEAADRIAKLEVQLQTAKVDHGQLVMQLNALTEESITLNQTVNIAKADVPDTAVLRQKLNETIEINAKVRANLKCFDASTEVAQLERLVADTTSLIERVDKIKREALAAVTFPVPGLGLTDDGVIFNELPFNQAATSEQLRVSVAIGLALNPKLKVLLIRSGNLLDDDSLKLVAAQAEAADAQVWCEYVTADAKDVQVMIEEGRVV